MESASNTTNAVDALRMVFMTVLHWDFYWKLDNPTMEEGIRSLLYAGLGAGFWAQKAVGSIKILYGISD